MKQSSCIFVPVLICVFDYFPSKTMCPVSQPKEVRPLQAKNRCCNALTLGGGGLDLPYVYLKGC
jgi:hypothetical protein